jgi:hypothetical protein
MHSFATFVANICFFSMALCGFALVLYAFPQFWPKRYCWNVLIAVDQLANALIAGDPDETISSRAAKRQHRRVWRWLGRVLEWIDPDHLAKSLEKDEGGRASIRSPPAILNAKRGQCSAPVPAPSVYVLWIRFLAPSPTRRGRAFFF